jgi:hypothetical protein
VGVEVRRRGQGRLAGHGRAGEDVGDHEARRPRDGRRLGAVIVVRRRRGRAAGRRRGGRPGPEVFVVVRVLEKVCQNEFSKRL